MLPSELKRDLQLGADVDVRQLNAAFASLSRDPLWALAVMFPASGRPPSVDGGGEDSFGDSKSMLQLAELLEAGSGGAGSGSGGSSASGSAGISRSSSEGDVLGLYEYAALAAQQQAEH
jgi:hypothetical protein